MLQLLVCSDVHTYVDNIRLAVHKMDRVDAILIAGDQEAEESRVLEACGDIPCYLVRGNNDYYLDTEYPQELLIDIFEDPGTSFRGPEICKVTELNYDSVPDAQGLPSCLSDNPVTSSIPVNLGNSTNPARPLSSLFARLFSNKKESPSRGLSFHANKAKRPRTVSHRILMTHGKEYNVPDITLLARRAGMWDADIVIFGHTHKFWDTQTARGKVRLINPGCLLGNPDDHVRSYAGYEICSFAVLRIGFQGEIDVRHLYL